MTDQMTKARRREGQEENNQSSRIPTNHERQGTEEAATETVGAIPAVSSPVGDSLKMANIRASLDLLRKHTDERLHKRLSIPQTRATATTSPQEAKEEVPVSTQVSKGGTPRGVPQSKSSDNPEQPLTTFGQNRPPTATRTPTNLVSPKPISSSSPTNSTFQRRIGDVDLSDLTVVNELSRSMVQRLHDQLRQQILTEMKVELNEPNEQFDQLVKKGFEELEQQKKKQKQLSSPIPQPSPSQRQLDSSPPTPAGITRRRSSTNSSDLRSPTSSIASPLGTSRPPLSSRSSSTTSQQSPMEALRPKNLYVNVGGRDELISPPLSTHPHLQKSMSNRSNASPASATSNTSSTTSSAKSRHQKVVQQSQVSRLLTQHASIRSEQSAADIQQLTSHPDVQALTELLSPKHTLSPASGSAVISPPLSGKSFADSSASPNAPVRLRSPSDTSGMDGFRQGNRPNSGSTSRAVSASHQLRTTSPTVNTTSPGTDRSPSLNIGMASPHGMPQPAWILVSPSHPLQVNTPGSSTNQLRQYASNSPAAPLANSNPMSPQPQLMYAFPVPISADGSISQSATPQNISGGQYFYAIPAPLSVDGQPQLTNQQLPFTAFNFNLSPQQNFHRLQSAPLMTSAATNTHSTLAPSNTSTPSQSRQRSPQPPTSRPQSESASKRPNLNDSKPPPFERSQTHSSIISPPPSATSAARMKRIRSVSATSSTDTSPQKQSECIPASSQTQLNTLQPQQYQPPKQVPRTLKLGNWTNEASLPSSPAKPTQPSASSTHRVTSTHAIPSESDPTSSTYRPLRSQTRHHPTNTQSTVKAQSSTARDSSAIIHGKYQPQKNVMLQSKTRRIIRTGPAKAKKKVVQNATRQAPPKKSQPSLHLKLPLPTHPSLVSDSLAYMHAIAEGDEIAAAALSARLAQGGSGSSGGRAPKSGGSTNTSMDRLPNQQQLGSSIFAPSPSALSRPFQSLAAPTTAAVDEIEEEPELKQIRVHPSGSEHEPIPLPPNHHLSDHDHTTTSDENTTDHEIEEHIQ